ncbi:MAG: septum formation initiator family protein [Alphaproteobacteria bacterium]|nr:septum formation initiator family protein [Alphaproteobacteria bacterium]
MKRVSFFHIVPLISVLITAYFVYHGIYGNRGFLRLQQIHQERAQEEIVANSVRREKDLLQKKVNALKSGAPDLVQEEALRVLNMGTEDDLIILESSSEN